MKESKAKPPAKSQTLLGVDWQIEDDFLFASAGKSPGILSQDAAKLAGKLNFACS